MPFCDPPSRSILVVDDIEETRSLLGRMLRDNGYLVDLAYDEEDAVSRAISRAPDLILVSLGVNCEQVITGGIRIRQRAHLGTSVAIVVFCVSTIPEGAEVEVSENVFVTRPDNFDQLRGFLRRLLGSLARNH